MAAHLVYATHPVATGHADKARPVSVSAFAPSVTAFPMFAVPVPQLKATWRKTTAVRCTSTGLNPAEMSTDGTDIATRRPPGGT